MLGESNPNEEILAKDFVKVLDELNNVVNFEANKYQTLNPLQGSIGATWPAWSPPFPEVTLNLLRKELGFHIHFFKKAKVLQLEDISFIKEITNLLLYLATKFYS